jgi:hypothetical protein
VTTLIGLRDAVPSLPTAPRRAVVACAGIGLAAATLVPLGSPGVGVAVLALTVWLLVPTVARARLRGWQGVHAACAVLLAGTAALREAPWLVTVTLLAALALGSLAVGGGRSWAGIAASLAAVPRTLPAAAPWLVRGAAAQRPDGRRLTPALRGAALTALLTAVVASLLASADPVFSALLGAATPSVPVDALPARLAVGAAAALAAGAALMLLIWPRPEPALRASRRATRPAEWAPPLVALTALLTAYLLVQLSVAVGGEQHVLRTAGVTWASHAREGFFQLLAVVALVLAVVAAGARWAPVSARPLLGALCVLAMAVDASALSRLLLYVEAYGLTRLRVAVIATALWLAVVLALVLLAGRRRWLPHGVVLATSVSLLLLAAADPDARIAASALARADRADLAYLAGLSVDAVPVLDRLPEPARSCVLPAALDGRSWTSWTASRARAAEVLAARPPGRCDLPLG